MNVQVMRMSTYLLPLAKATLYPVVPFQSHASKHFVLYTPICYAGIQEIKRHCFKKKS